MGACGRDDGGGGWVDRLVGWLGEGVHANQPTETALANMVSNCLGLVGRSVMNKVTIVCCCVCVCVCVFVCVCVPGF